MGQFEALLQTLGPHLRRQSSDWSDTSLILSHTLSSKSAFLWFSARLSNGVRAERDADNELVSCCET